jgi:hypothetical protein
MAVSDSQLGDAACTKPAVRFRRYLGQLVRRAIGKGFAAEVVRESVEDSLAADMTILQDMCPGMIRARIALSLKHPPSAVGGARASLIGPAALDISHQCRVQSGMMRRLPLLTFVLVPMILPSGAVRAFERVNYLEPSAGSISGNFTLRAKVGHRFSQCMSLEVAGSFAPAVREDYSSLIYIGALRYGVKKLVPLRWMEPSLAIGGGSHSIIGGGRRETDPVLTATAGFGFRLDEKVNAMMEGGLLTVFEESEPAHMGLFFAGISFVF